jgi:hypothetical protein
VVSFRVAGFGLFQGNLTVKASYAVESPQRVSISFIESTLVSVRKCGSGQPLQLQHGRWEAM